MKSTFEDENFFITVSTKQEPLQSRVCSRCQSLEASEEAKRRLADLAARVSSLFDVQEDITSAKAPDGTPAVTFALGCSQRRDDELQAVDVMVGKLWEQFQRVFGENNTGRKLYWRERPNLFSQQEFFTRRINRAVWMRVAIPDLPNAEKKNLLYLRGEVDALSFDELERLEGETFYE